MANITQYHKFYTTKWISDSVEENVTSGTMIIEFVGREAPLTIPLHSFKDYHELVGLIEGVRSYAYNEATENIVNKLQDVVKNSYRI